MSSEFPNHPSPPYNHTVHGSVGATLTDFGAGGRASTEGRESSTNMSFHDAIASADAAADADSDADASVTVADSDADDAADTDDYADADADDDPAADASKEGADADAADASVTDNELFGVQDDAEGTGLDHDEEKDGVDGAKEAAAAVDAFVGENESFGIEDVVDALQEDASEEGTAADAADAADSADAGDAGDAAAEMRGLAHEMAMPIDEPVAGLPVAIAFTPLPASTAPDVRGLAHAMARPIDKPIAGLPVATKFTFLPASAVAPCAAGAAGSVAVKRRRITSTNKKEVSVATATAATTDATEGGGDDGSAVKKKRSLARKVEEFKPPSYHTKAFAKWTSDGKSVQAWMEKVKEDKEKAALARKNNKRKIEEYDNMKASCDTAVKVAEEKAARCNKRAKDMKASFDSAMEKAKKRISKWENRAADLATLARWVGLSDPLLVRLSKGTVTIDHLKSVYVKNSVGAQVAARGVLSE